MVGEGGRVPSHGNLVAGARQSQSLSLCGSPPPSLLTQCPSRIGFSQPSEAACLLYACLGHSMTASPKDHILCCSFKNRQVLVTLRGVSSPDPTAVQLCHQPQAPRILHVQTSSPSPVCSAKWPTTYSVTPARNLQAAPTPRQLPSPISLATTC